MIYILNNFCDSQAGYKIMGILGTVISIIKICVPIILILVGTIELVKSIMSQKDKMQEVTKKLIKKAILALTIFFVPSIVMFLINMIGIKFDGKECMACLLDYPQTCIEISDNISNNKADGLCAPKHSKPEECKKPCEYTNGFCQRVE